MKKPCFTSWDDLPVALSLDIVAAIFQRTYECVRTWAKQNKIPATKTPTGWVVEKQALIQWMTDNGNEAMKSVAK